MLAHPENRTEFVFQAIFFERCIEMPKRGPGRPRKNAASPAHSPVKRGPGRPPKNAASPASVKSPKPAPASSVSPALIGRSSGGVSRSMSNLRSPPPREREAKLESPIAKSGRKPSRSMTNPHNDDPPQRLSRVAPSGGAASSGAKSSARKRPSAKGTSSKSKRPRPIKDAQGHLRYIVAEVRTVLSAGDH